MTMVKKDKSLQWAIKYIKELSFMVNESIDPKEEIAMKYQVDVKTDTTDADLIRFRITVHYTERSTHEEFLSSSVETGYVVKGLKDLKEESEDGDLSINLPDKLWVALFSMAYSHTRAILARSAYGSKFQHLILPPINPEQEFKRVFDNKEILD